MKVGTVRPSSQGLGYLKAVDTPYAGAISRSLANLGEVAVEFGGRLREREDKTAKLQALTEYSKFETKVNEDLANLKRDFPANGAGYVDQANSIYSTLENDFFTKSVPEDMQEEFKLKTTEFWGRIADDSLNFQFAQQDAFFRTGIKDAYEQAKVELAQFPDSYDTQSKKLAEFIQASDLPDISHGQVLGKADLIKTMDQGLKTIVYGKQVEQIKRQASTTPYAAKVVGAESGGKTTAKNPNSSAEGLGQFIDSTWKQFIAARHPDLLAQGEDIYKFKKDRDLSIEAVEWLADENSRVLTANGVPVTDGTLYLAHFAGADGAVKLMSAGPDATAEEVLGSRVIDANPFLRGKSAAYVVEWANKKMGGDYSQLDENPAFEGIPLEDRLTMQGDAETKVNAENAQAAAQLKAQLETQKNNIYTLLHDGQGGKALIEASRRSGVLTDIDDIEKAEAIWEKYNKGVEGRLTIQSMLDNPAIPYNPAIHAGFLNDYVGKEGLAEIGAGNKDYVEQVIVPLAEKLHDFPTDTIGLLMGMSRSNDPKRAMFALDTLAQLEQADARAFGSRIPEQLAQDVDLWEARKEFLPQDELMKQLRGGMTTSERQSNQFLEDEAKSLLARSDKGGLSHLEAIIPGVLHNFDRSWAWRDPSLVLPAQMAGLKRDYRSLFLALYPKYGNEADTDKAVQKALGRVYGSTFIGGKQTIMKYPPEKTGYKELGGSFDWIDRSIRESLKLEPGVEFNIISDDQTASELADRQLGRSEFMPSYMIATKKDGVWSIVEDETRKPIRGRFTPEPTDLVIETQQFEEKVNRMELRDLLGQRDAMRFRGENVPESLDRRIEELAPKSNAGPTYSPSTFEVDPNAVPIQ